MQRQLRPVGRHLYEVELLYTDKNRNKWWGLVDVAGMPIKRTQVMLSKTNFADVGLDKAFVKTCMKQIREFSKVGNQAAVEVLTEAFEQRCDFRFNSKTLLECALSTLLLNDEDVSQISQLDERKKWEALEADQEAYDFFLSWAFRTSTEFYFNWHNSADSLTMSQAKEKLLERHLNNEMERLK